ncbi:hypothetical protein ANABIO32_06400 [Rossellomorea marisflavi]|nr:hypothetical protein ANABIO32_06400 [Rossellomorea marisflavi]
MSFGEEEKEGPFDSNKVNRGVFDIIRFIIGSHICDYIVANPVEDGG